ncbi:M4 family metallopeptidase [Metabacillus sp. RGM 3146]|uniref:M4 family metallopeptidase n=1 Tax=Metabacillus sp. RGM 3146 TaxID=3401092 RepID=UPI003B9D1CF3
MASASASSLPKEKQLLEKMQLVQQQWDKQKSSPSFLSGKLSALKIQKESEVKSFLKENNAVYKVDPNADLILVKIEKDNLGFTHYKYVQSINGVPIEGAAFTVHVDKNGNVTATNGTLHPDASSKVKSDTKAKLSSKKAIELAWKSINLTKKDTFVPSPAVPAPLKPSNVENTTEKHNLLIYNKDGQYHLAYKVQLQFIKPYGANWQIFVDAKDGSILDSLNAVEDAATTGSGYGVLGDKKTLNTYFSNNTYYLYDVTKSAQTGVIETFTASNGTSLPGYYSVDSDNAFNSTSQRADVDAHYYAGKVYDYYYNTFGRNSFDNAGATIRSTVHYSSNYNNAYWNGSQMVYGDGDGVTFTSLSGALDVVAHELTHAVTERTAGLNYSYQSGALNESISDTFGVFNDPGDYLMGEDVYTPGKSGDALRSLSNPEAYGQPSTMSGYVNTSSDNGGVHTNSGIPNKAAYLTIQSIGKSAAGKIYYRALTQYMTPTTNFSNARAALLQSAADLYGSGSATYNAVKSAWDQVQVY